MYSWCKNRLVFCMLYRFNLCLKQLWHHAESFVLGKESRMLSNQIFCFSSFTFPSLSGIKPCQQGEKLCFSVWRVTFYAQFLHTVRSADIVSVSWLFPVRGAEFFCAKERGGIGKVLCNALCCAVQLLQCAISCSGSCFYAFEDESWNLVHCDAAISTVS